MPAGFTFTLKTLRKPTIQSIQAFRIAEHDDVQLPVIVGLDGFIVSHTLENVDVLSDDGVKEVRW